MTVDKEAILDVLNECKDYFENKADADHDENGYVPNIEMRYCSELTLVIQQITKLLSSNEAKEKECEYWKQRCEAAEDLIQPEFVYENDKEKYKKWQQLKT